MKAKANVVQADQYKSDRERLFARFGPAILEHDYGRKVFEMRYEPETFHVPGGSYTPDFRVVFEDGLVAFVEVKANKNQRNYRDARSKLRAAAELNQIYTWIEARVTLRKSEITACDLEVIE